MIALPALALAVTVAATPPLAGDQTVAGLACTHAPLLAANDPIADPARLASVQLAATDPLVAARQAFSAGQYDAAEKLALQAADSSAPQKGAALYLAGLARFRSGRPDAALEALDAAGTAPDPPERAQWQFNRAACLYELGRFRESEQAYLESASDPALASVAYANAGFAALDAGATDRAATLAQRARARATEAELPLVDDLDAQISAARDAASTPATSATAPSSATTTAPSSTESAEAAALADAYEKALAAFDAGHFEEARTDFLTIAEKTTASGRARLMAGASAYRLGMRSEARADLVASLALPLSTREAEIAHEYLDRLSAGMRSNPEGAEAWASVGLGFDSNPLLLGIAQRDVLAGPRGPPPFSSPFAEAFAAATYRIKLSSVWAADVTYTGEQRAYVTPLAQDYSTQQHRLTGRLELAPTDRFRLGLTGGGEVAFTGLSSFRGLQASWFAGAWAAFDETATTGSRIDLAYARKVGLNDEFSYLTGNRYDVTASQQFRLRASSATVWYRYRADLIGTLTEADSTVVAPAACTGCTFAFVVPFAWTGHAAGLTLRLPLGDGFELSGDAGVEHRTYTAQNFLQVTRADGSVLEWDARQREDTRFLLSPEVSVRLLKWLTLTARYDLVLNRSNIDSRIPDEVGTCASPDYVCHELDYANENYTKHVVTFELGGNW